MFEIESDVPLYGKKIPGRKSKYPFSLMKVDDSFLVQCHEKRKRNIQTSLMGCANRWKEKNKKNWKFTTREETNGIRIWRIK